MKRVASYAIIVLLTLGAVLLAWEVRAPLALFLLAVALAAALDAPAGWLTSRGVPRTVSLLAVYALTVAVALALVYTAGASVLSDLPEVTDDVVLGYERLFTRLLNSERPLPQALAAQLPSPQGLYDGLTGQQGLSLLAAGLGFARGIAGAATSMGVIITLSFYWALAEAHFERLGLALLTAQRRSSARSVWRKLTTQVGAFVRWQGIQTLLAIVLLWAGYALMRMPYPAVLAVALALLLLVPAIGTAIALLLAALAGLTLAPLLALAAVAYLLLVVLLLRQVLRPLLWPQQPGSYVLLLMLVLAMGDALGLVGALLAPTAFVAAEVLWRHVVHRPLAAPTMAGRVQETEERLVRIQQRATSLRTLPQPEVQSLAKRLDQLLNETREALLRKDRSEA